MSPKSKDFVAYLMNEVNQNPKLTAMVEEERNRLQLADKIRALREKAGITQTELAKRIGTSQPVIARIESADYDRLTVTTLLRISRALNHRFEIGFIPIRKTRSGHSRRAQAA